jgi:glycosyltransferase involved in cell wall biosynthesis
MSRTVAAAGRGAAPVPVLSAIVPVLDGGDNFARCLAALTASPPTPAWELIVVDDGSADGSPDWARAAGARVLCTPRARSGPGAARNLGATVARGEVLLFLDADVLVTPRTIGQVVAAFRREPALAALFGSYDARPGARNFLSQYKNLFHHYVHQNSSAEATTFWAGCGAIRREVFLGLGGFDPAFGRPSIEDIELGYRLTRSGYSVRLCHDIQVTHLKRWTPRSLLLTDIRDRGLPWMELLLRGRVYPSDLNLNLGNRISVICAGLVGVTLLAAVMWPVALLFTLLAAITLLSLNLPLYRFFYQERGAWFALATVPWVWLYYSYSGLCVVLGAFTHLRAGRPTIGSMPPHEAISDAERRVAA